MRNTILFLSIPLLVACNGNSKKQGLVDKEEKTEETRIVYTGLDTLPSNKGVKYVGKRLVDKSNPPVVINYDNSSIKEESFDIGQYYDKVSYVKLKHPGTEEGKNQFLTPKRMMARIGAASVDMLFKVLVTDKYILAGDPFYGLHCYDRDGSFLYTLSEIENPPKQKKGAMDVDFRAIPNVLAHFNVVGDICMYTTLDGDNAMINFHDLNTRRTYYQRVSGIQKAMPIDSKTFIDYNYNLIESERVPFITIMNTERDTLSQFINYNILPKLSGSVYYNPGPSNLYYFENQLSVRQVSNDTIYRVVSEQEFRPAYVLNWGKKKADLQDLTSGKYANKKIPWDLLETDKFIYVKYNEFGEDNKDAKYKRASIFDKSTHRIFIIPNSENEEEDNLVIKNSIQDGIPFRNRQMKSLGKGLYCIYLKEDLETLIESKSFASLQSDQQGKIRVLHDGLDEKEVLIMLIE